VSLSAGGDFAPVAGEGGAGTTGGALSASARAIAAMSRRFVGSVTARTARSISTSSLASSAPRLPS